MIHAKANLQRARRQQTASDNSPLFKLAQGLRCSVRISTRNPPTSSGGRRNSKRYSSLLVERACVYQHNRDKEPASLNPFTSEPRNIGTMQFTRASTSLRSEGSPSWTEEISVVALPFGFATLGDGDELGASEFSGWAAAMVSDPTGLDREGGGGGRRVDLWRRYSIEGFLPNERRRKRANEGAEERQNRILCACVYIDIQFR